VTCTRIIRCWLSTAVAIAVLSALTGWGGDTGPDAYNLAAAVSNGIGSGSQLLVFPSHAQKFSIPLPLSLQWVVYGPGGQSLYVVAFGRPGLQKIQFNPTRVSTLPGSEAFSDFHGFAVSHREDKVLNSGMRNVSPRTCDILELSLPAGNLSLIRQRSDCATVLDLSLNGTQALIRDASKHLELLDLAHGTAKSIGEHLWGGSYSPDGKWIAALLLGAPRVPSRTVLIDPNDFSMQRDLGGLNDDEVVWSPDSRLLVHAISRPSCSSANSIALEILEVETAKRSTVKDTICSVGTDRAFGWIRSDIKK
jgi:hypothetical protein